MFKLSRKEIVTLVGIPLIGFCLSSVHAASKPQKKRKTTNAVVTKPTQACVGWANILLMVTTDETASTKVQLNCTSTNGSNYPCSFCVTQTLSTWNGSGWQLLNSSREEAGLLCSYGNTYTVSLPLNGYGPGIYQYATMVYSGACNGNGGLLTTYVDTFNLPLNH